ncbi:MAG: carotenoid 1,2-hydratase [Myxococcota bacterium]|nr:carotenoid 1,2-hydratase [Myxococcota bacterium]
MPADEFCALNVALYHRKAGRWAFTEWPSEQVDRTATHFALGPSRLEWSHGNLVVDIVEESPRRRLPLRGKVTLYPEVTSSHVQALDAGEKHRWHPIAPKARFEARFEEPALAFSGSAYHDSNDGVEPLEASLERWSWARFDTPRGPLAVYETVRRDGSQANTAALFSSDGSLEPAECFFGHPLPRTFVWAFPRTVGWLTTQPPRVVRTFEDTPFYSRSLLEARLDGQPCFGVHESLSLKRFATSWMQRMLPFRILDRK